MRPIKGTLVNSVDPDQAATDQDLHCLRQIQEFLLNVVILKSNPIHLILEMDLPKELKQKSPFGITGLSVFSFSTSVRASARQNQQIRPIMKTCLYNLDPLKPRFYILKLRFTGVYIIFLISAQKH